MAATETGSERRIYAGMFWVQPLGGGIDKNVNTPLDENVMSGVDKNVNPQEENNINITPSSPPEGESAAAAGKKPARRRRTPKEVPDWKPERFAGFWGHYPRGENRQGAIRAWDRLKPSDELIDTMAHALRRQMEREVWQRGIGIPYASTWLNNRRWEDETRLTLPEAAPPSGSAWAPDPEVM